jgi:hypothetical protein
MRSDEELKQIAIDILAGRIFTSNHIGEDMLMHTFMVMALMSEEEKVQFMEKKPVMVFEYLSKAGPRSVNGYPVFLSLEYLVEDELNIVNKYYDALKKAQDEVKI